MTDKQKNVQGLPLETWESMYRPGMPEYAASMFVFSREHPGFVRIAFGMNGPVVDDAGKRQPVFGHAVLLPPEVAVELARQLLKHYAEPEYRPSTQEPKG